MLDVTFAGNRITPVNNSNWPLLNDPKINAAIAHAKTILAPQARWAAWGKIDQMVTQSAARRPVDLGELPDALLEARHARHSSSGTAARPDVTFMSVSGS